MAVDPRLETLGACMEECSKEEATLQNQIRTSANGLAAEGDSAREQAEKNAAELQALQAERQRLLDQLSDVETKMRAVQTRGSQLDGREQQLKRVAHSDTDELCKRLGRLEERGRRAAAQSHLLTSSAELARVIEQQLDARVTAVASVQQERECSESSRPALGFACLAEELARTKALEELCAALHGNVWGSNAAEHLSGDRPRVVALRAAHERALVLVEQAWRESVQLSAEVMGQKDAPLGLSEALSRAGKQYKDMRQQLASNHERLMQMGAGLPAQAQPLSFEESPLRSPPKAPVLAEAAAPSSEEVVRHLAPDFEAE